MSKFNLFNIFKPDFFGPEYSKVYFFCPKINRSPSYTWFIISTTIIYYCLFNHHEVQNSHLHSVGISFMGIV